MATKSHNTTLTPTQTPDGLAALVRRLRDQANGMKNRAALRTLGQDILEAALVIEQRLVLRDIDATKLVAPLPAREARALAKMASRFRREDAEQFSSRGYGGSKASSIADRDAMLDGMNRLGSALAHAGYVH